MKLWRLTCLSILIFLSLTSLAVYSAYKTRKLSEFDNSYNTDTYYFSNLDYYSDYPVDVSTQFSYGYDLSTENLTLMVNWYLLSTTNNITGINVTMNIKDDRTNLQITNFDQFDIHIYENTQQDQQEYNLTEVILFHRLKVETEILDGISITYTFILTFDNGYISDTIPGESVSFDVIEVDFFRNLALIFLGVIILLSGYILYSRSKYELDEIGLTAFLLAHYLVAFVLLYRLTVNFLIDPLSIPLFSELIFTPFLVVMIPVLIDYKKPKQVKIRNEYRKLTNINLREDDAVSQDMQTKRITLVEGYSDQLLVDLFKRSVLMMLVILMLPLYTFFITLYVTYVLFR